MGSGSLHWAYSLLCIIVIYVPGLSPETRTYALLIPNPQQLYEFCTEQITDSLVVKGSTPLNIKVVSANIFIKYLHDFILNFKRSAWCSPVCALTFSLQYNMYIIAL